MKKTLFTCLAVCFLGVPLSRAQYTDHRGHDLDSLERAVVGWTPERIAVSGDEDCTALAEAYTGLMWGYMSFNPDRGMLFARKLLELGTAKDWLWRQFDANRVISQYHYGWKQYDSAFFYYSTAQTVIERMQGRYEQINIDDARSQLYGSLGNLYNEMDSLSKALEQYGKAGEIFEKYGWKESSSVLYHNLGETWLEKGRLKDAEQCYEKALQFGREASDSLQIAEALAGLGAVYLEQGKTGKALRFLQDADEYYIRHEDQEWLHRISALDLIGQVLKAQKRHLVSMVAGGIVIILLLVTIIVYMLRTRRLRKEKAAADEVIDQALKSIRVVVVDDGRLTDREREILPLLAQGLTSSQIADRLYLSLPTIKWYRRRLLDRFEARNTAEVISKAREQGLL